MNGFMGRMKNALNAAPKGLPPYRLFSEAIEVEDRKRVEEDRGTTWPMHVSSVIENYCARKLYLMLESNRTFTRSPSSADQVVWAIGKATEEHCKKQIIKQYGTHNVYGKWSCICQERVAYGLGKDPHKTKCPFCKTSVFSEYHELPLQYDDLIMGRPDLMVISQPYGKLKVIELKSKNGKDFEALTKPDVQHVMQDYFYLRLIEHNIERFREQGVEPHLDSFHVLYTNKHYSFKRDREAVYKEFEIKTSALSDAFKQVFDDTITELRQLKNSLSIPTRTVCDSATCKRAKGCAVALECFQYGD